jgi:hypothetical protein
VVEGKISDDVNTGSDHQSELVRIYDLHPKHPFRQMPLAIRKHVLIGEHGRFTGAESGFPKSCCGESGVKLLEMEPQSAMMDYISTCPRYTQCYLLSTIISAVQSSTYNSVLEVEPITITWRSIKTNRGHHTLDTAHNGFNRKVRASFQGVFFLIVCAWLTKCWSLGIKFQGVPKASV